MPIQLDSLRCELAALKARIDVRFDGDLQSELKDLQAEDRRLQNRQIDLEHRAARLGQAKDPGAAKAWDAADAAEKEWRANLALLVKKQQEIKRGRGQRGPHHRGRGDGYSMDPKEFAALKAVMTSIVLESDSEADILTRKGWARASRGTMRATGLAAREYKAELSMQKSVAKHGSEERGFAAELLAAKRRRSRR
jgi:hypothetical protein